jgi:hypothetical protein
MLNLDERELFQQLVQTYTPDADAFCSLLVQKVELIAERHMGNLCEFDFNTTVPGLTYRFQHRVWTVMFSSHECLKSYRHLCSFHG